MKNLSSYCGLVDAKIRASDRDLPVLGNRKKQVEVFTLDFILSKVIDFVQF